MPTMWRSGRTVELLKAYNECPHVDEIILINNDPKNIPELPEIDSMEKLCVTSFGSNMFVNPAWNYGMITAKNPYAIISNDDISFDVNAVLEFMSDKEFDCVGVHPVGINSDDKHELEIVDGTHIGNGWGVLLFIKRITYKKIPGMLKIWFGDNWIQMTSPNAQSLILNLETEMSVTSGSSEFTDVIRMDISNWIRMNDLGRDAAGMASHLY